MAKKTDTAAPADGETLPQVPPAAVPESNPAPKQRTAEEQAAKDARLAERAKAKADAAKASGLPVPMPPAPEARVKPAKSLLKAIDDVIADIKQHPASEPWLLAVRKLTAAKNAVETASE